MTSPHARQQSANPQARFVLASPGSNSPERTADVFGRSAAAAAIQWNCHLAISGPEKFLSALTAALRVPPERPLIVPGTRYDGAMVRLATRAHRLAQELTSRPRPNHAAITGVSQKMFIEALNEYLSRGRRSDQRQ